jgi:hypothetical protein
MPMEIRTLKTIVAAIVSLAVALTVITVVAAQGQGRAHSRVDAGATPTPEATCPTAGASNQSSCGSTATPFPVTVVTSSPVGSTAPIPGAAAATSHTSSPHGKGQLQRAHGKATVHGHAGAVHENQREQGSSDDTDEGDHPNNHGAAVSQAAKSGCTAVNPHNPKVRNHGMCVSAIARGNH